MLCANLPLTAGLPVRVLLQDINCAYNGAVYLWTYNKKCHSLDRAMGTVGFSVWQTSE